MADCPDCAGTADDAEMVAVFPANERLYGRCDTCGAARWMTDRYQGDGAGQDIERATHCGCCSHSHNLPPGGHTLRAAGRDAAAGLEVPDADR